MINTKDTDHKFHYYVIVSIILYRTNDCITKLLMSNLGTFEIMFFRSLFAILFFATIIIWIKLNFRIFLDKFVLLRNFLAAIALFFEVASLKYLSLSTFILINFTFSIFAKLFGWLFLSEKISQLDIFVIFLSIIGGLFIINVSFDQPNIHGASLALSGVIFYALSLVVTKKVKSEDYGAICFSCAIVIFLLSAIYIPKSLPQKIDFYYLLLMTVIHIAAFLLSIKGLKELKTSKVAILEYLGLVFAVVYDYIFWNHMLSFEQIIGASIIIFSSLLSIYRAWLTTLLEKIYIFLRKRSIGPMTNASE